MRTLSRVTCAALAGIALLGVAGLSSTATAATATPLGVSTVVSDGEVSTSSTRAFWIENRTAERLTLVRFAGVGDPLLPEDSFPENKVIEPGQTMRIELTSGVFSNGGHRVEVRFQGDKVRWTPAQDVPAWDPGPGICSDRGGPIDDDCSAHTIPPQPYFGEASMLLNVWGYTRTSFAVASAFGPVLAGGEAIVITDGSGAMSVSSS